MRTWNDTTLPTTSAAPRPPASIAFSTPALTVWPGGGGAFGPRVKPTGTAMVPGMPPKKKERLAGVGGVPVITARSRGLSKYRVWFGACPTGTQLIWAYATAEG